MAAPFGTVSLPPPLAGRVPPFAGASSAVLPAVAGIVFTGYPDAVFTDAPAGYWRQGEPSGTIMADTSNSYYDGTYVNTPGLGATGLVSGSDTAVTYAAASSQYGIVTDSGTKPLLDFTTALTVEAVIKPSDLTGEHHIVNKNHYNLILSGDQVRVELELNDGTNFNRFSVFSTTHLSIGQTHHVAGVYDKPGAQILLYIDGQLDNTAAVTAGRNVTTNDDPLVVGANYNTTQYYFDGVIDEVAVYNTALSATRILAHFNAGLGDRSSGATLAETATITVTGVVGSSTGAALAATDAIQAGASAGSDSALAAADTIAAAGFVGKVIDASGPSETDALTATGIVGKLVGATLAATVAVTGTGVVGTSSGSTVNGTGTVTAGGVVGTISGSTLSATDTVTTGGAMAMAGSATLAATDAISGLGTMAAAWPAALAEADTVTTAGVVGAITGTALPATDTVTAAGVVAKATGVTLSATVTITAAPSGAPLSTGSTVAETGAVTGTGVVGKLSGSSINATDALTTAGIVGKATAATVAGSDALTAAGVVGRLSGATMADTAGIAAAGSVATSGGATLSTAGTISAAGYAASAIDPDTAVVLHALPISRSLVAAVRQRVLEEV